MLSGALSGITDLASTDATATMLVNVLISVGQLQRDLQNELTREGLAAAWAQGPIWTPTTGRRPRGTGGGAPGIQRKGEHRRPGPPPPRQPGRDPHRRGRPAARLTRTTPTHRR